MQRLVGMLYSGSSPVCVTAKVNLQAENYVISVLLQYITVNGYMFIMFISNNQHPDLFDMVVS